MSKQRQQQDPVDSGTEVTVLGTDSGRVLTERYPSGCLVLAQDAPPESWPTSMEAGSARWKAALVNSATTPDLEIGAEWSEPFVFTDWLVMWRESVDEKTGEIKRYPWLSLICADGSIVGTSSEFVPHQVARMLRSYTPDEWRQGIPVRVRRRLNRAGTRSYHELRVAQ